MVVLCGRAISCERGTPVWHIQDSQGQILGMAFMYKALKCFRWFPLRPEADCTTTSDLGSSQLENNYFTEMCSGSEAGSYLRRIDFVYHSTLGLRVIKKQKKTSDPGVVSAGKLADIEQTRHYKRHPPHPHPLLLVSCMCIDCLVCDRDCLLHDLIVLYLALNVLYVALTVLYMP